MKYYLGQDTVAMIKKKSRAAGIGFGQKTSRRTFSIEGLASTPCATKYDLPSTNTSLSKSFGVHKKFFKARDLRPNLMGDLKYPGPGYYKTEKPLDSEARYGRMDPLGKFDHGNRREQGSMLDTTTKFYPGPG